MILSIISDKHILIYRPKVTLQSLREDVNLTISTYVCQGSPLQLNLSSTERSLLSYALTRSLHPSSLALAANYVESHLRTESYPKFILSTFSNANPPRIVWAYCTGALLILSGLALGALTVMKSHAGDAARRHWHRATRLLGVIPFFVGVVTVYAAWHGMCVILHQRGRYQRRPWDTYYLNRTSGTSASGSDWEKETGAMGRYFRMGDGEEWQERGSWRRKYTRRFLLRRIFDREAMIKEQHILDGQRVVFGQAVWMGLLVSLPLCVLLLAV